MMSVGKGGKKREGKKEEEKKGKEKKGKKKRKKNERKKERKKEKKKERKITPFRKGGSESCKPEMHARRRVDCKPREEFLLLLTKGSERGVQKVQFGRSFSTQASKEAGESSPL